MPKRNDEEHKIQCGIIDWYDIRHRDGMLFAIPNGGARDVRTGARLKREGVRPGVWDLCLSVACGLYHGLYVEVKNPRRKNHKHGGLTPEQYEFGVKARKNGYRCEDIAYTTQEGIYIIGWYLSGMTGPWRFDKKIRI